MKVLEEIKLDLVQCRKEVMQLRKLLDSQSELAERKEILPFFKSRKHLSAMIGFYNPRIARPDRVAHEYQLFGDFACDLVVGDSNNNAYVFVEFEDAVPGSIFVKKGKKDTPEWSPRFEHGFSQLIDWFYKLHDQSPTTAFQNKFGSKDIKHVGLLAIGRKEDLGTQEIARLLWRQQYVLLNSQQVHCLTFDQLCDDLLARVQMYIDAAKTTKAKKKP